MSTRRELMQWLAATSGLAGLDALAGRDLVALGRATHRAAAAAPGVRAALDPHGERTVTSAAEIILPGGDTPGATAAGVSAFVDRMLAGWYTTAERDRFLAGLRDLDARSTSRCARAFADCAPADQVALLTALDDEVSALRTGPGSLADQHWFAILRYLTIWGYCTSAAGAESLGLATLPMRYDGNAPYAPAAGRR